MIDTTMTAIDTVKLIDNVELSNLRSADYLSTDLLLSLGLHEGVRSQLPINLHAFCGYGLQLKQIPRAFAQWLVWATERPVREVFFIGVDPATAAVTSRILMRTSGLALAHYAGPVDASEQTLLSAVGVTLISNDNALIPPAAHRDLVVLSGRASMALLIQQWQTIKNFTRRVALDEVAAANLADVKNFWAHLSLLYPADQLRQFNTLEDSSDAANCAWGTVSMYR